MGRLLLTSWLSKGVGLSKWSQALAVAAGAFAGGWEATTWAQEPAPAVQPALNDLLVPIGLRHKLFGRRDYCDDCQTCVPDDAITAMPGQPTTPENTIPDYSQPSQSAPEASNFGFANMLGDSPFGGCVTLNAGVFALDMEHPRFACERSNLAENNSPIPRDRAFFSYRRFINATSVDVFDGVDFGGSVGVFDGSSVLDIDQYTLGFEKTMFCEQMSVEMRLPLSYQIGSKFDINGDTTNGSGFLSGLPITDRELELGNVNIIFKSILKESCNWVVSGGVGLGLPTAKNVTTNIRLRDTSYEFEYYDSMIYDFLVSNVNLNIGTVVGNEIVNLTPFIAASYAPNDRAFHQFFGQIDVPLNDACVKYTINGTVSNSETINYPGGQLIIDPQASNFDLKMSQQTIARLNYQFGYWLFRDDNASRLRGLAGLFELHYTSTLNNARGNSIVLDPNDPNAGMANADFIRALGGDPTQIFHLFDVFNSANRVDILNLSVGGLMRYGLTDIQGGYVFPLREGEDKPFDGEFHLLVNRNF